MNTCKKILLAVALPMLVQLSFTKAQPGYEQAMATTLKALGTAYQPAEFIAIANRFEQIARTATEEWVPAYHAAYSQLFAGIVQEKTEAKDRFFEKAMELVDMADRRQAANSEIHALRGYVQYMQMSVDPQNRLGLIEKAAASLERAMALDPENPRPLFINGQTTFYTPAFFGGGAKAAKPLLEQAMQKFDTFTPTVPFAPDWGKAACADLLEKATASDRTDPESFVY